jgi:hypothetical protein
MIDALALRPCARCGEPIELRSRADRRTCSVACRVSLWRATGAQRRPTSARGAKDTVPALIERHAAL